MKLCTYCGSRRHVAASCPKRRMHALVLQLMRWLPVVRLVA